MKRTCNNCQRRENADGSDCRFFGERESDPFSDYSETICGRWEAEPDRFYAVVEKGFIAFPHYPNDEEFEAGKDGVLVKVKKIVKAYMKLNKWKRSVIIFYMMEPDYPGFSTVLMPEAVANRKKITKLVKAMIPRLSFNCILIEDLWDKTEEDVAHAAAAPPPNDRDTDTETIWQRPYGGIPFRP